MSSNTRHIKEKLIIGVSLAPATVIALLFSYLAFVFCLVISFTDWNMLRPMEFVGFENYVYAFTSIEFLNSLKLSFIYALWGVPLCVIIGLGIGMLLNWVTVWSSFFRVMVFLPVVTSMVVACIVWGKIFDPQIGVLNKLLEAVGISTQSHWFNWIKDSRGGSMAALLIVGIWKQVGYNGILFLGGLKNISKEYYEAALIDGANGWNRFARITLPLLSPTTFMVTMLQVFSAFKVIVSVLVLTQGGPANSTDVLVHHIYTNAFKYFNMGYSSAVSIVLFVIILAFTIIQLTCEKKFVYYR